MKLHMVVACDARRRRGEIVVMFLKNTVHMEHSYHISLILEIGE